MNISTIWEFVAGDSRRAPVAVLIAVVLAAVLVRTQSLPSAAIGGVLFTVVALGLVAGVFERT